MRVNKLTDRKTKSIVEATQECNGAILYMIQLILICFLPQSVGVVISKCT